MHSITLSFPTLTELHAAIAKILGAAEQTVVAAEQTVVAAERHDAGLAIALAKGKPKAEKPAAPAAVASAPAPVASAPAASAPKADAVDYPTLQKAVFRLAGIPEVGRAAATEVSAAFGVKTFKDLPSDRWAEALAAVTAKIDSLSVPA